MGRETQKNRAPLTVQDDGERDPAQTGSANRAYAAGACIRESCASGVVRTDSGSVASEETVT